MNSTIFSKTFANETVSQAFIASSETEDDLGCFLRIHLISETYLEAFISSALENGELFSDSPADGIKLQMNYASKAQLACKLGLHQNAFKALMLLNKTRNKAAHNMLTDLITKDLINNLRNFAHGIGTRQPNELNDHGVKFFNADNTLKAAYKFDSDGTPERVKLMIIIAAVFTWAAEDAKLLTDSILL